MAADIYTRKQFCDKDKWVHACELVNVIEPVNLKDVVQRRCYIHQHLVSGAINHPVNQKPQGGSSSTHRSWPKDQHTWARDTAAASYSVMTIDEKVEPYIRRLTAPPFMENHLRPSRFDPSLLFSDGDAHGCKGVLYDCNPKKALATSRGANATVAGSQGKRCRFARKRYITFQ